MRLSEVVWRPGRGQVLVMSECKMFCDFIVTETMQKNWYYQ